MFYILKYRLFLFFLVTMTINGQNKIDHQLVEAIKQESYENSQAYDMLDDVTNSFGPRLSGSESYMEAAIWAKNKLRSWGLKNVYFEPYAKNFRKWELNYHSVEIIKPRYMRLNALPYAWVSGTKGEVTGTPLIIDHQNFDELLKYKGKLKDRIILNPNTGSRDDVRTGPFSDEILKMAANHDIPNNPEGLDNSGLEPYAETVERKIRDKEISDKIQRFLINEKVAAVITGSPSQPGIIYAKQLPYHQKGDIKPIPHFVITKNHHRLLIKMIKDNIKPKLKLELNVDFKENSKNHVNLFGEITGVDPKLKDEFVLIGGHFDSYHSGTGAADNGQGSITLMEVMRIFKKLNFQPRRTIRIALWGGEEQGWNGSLAYLYKYLGDPIRGKIKKEHSKISAYFNHDNNGHNIRGIFLQGNPQLRPIFNEYLLPFNDVGARTISVENACCTDHVPFDALNIPAFEWIQDPMHYFSHQIHTDLDIIDLVDQNSLSHNVAIIATFVYHTSMRDEILPRKK